MHKLKNTLFLFFSFFKNEIYYFILIVSIILCFFSTIVYEVGKWQIYWISEGWQISPMSDQYQLIGDGCIGLYIKKDVDTKPKLSEKKSYGWPAISSKSICYPLFNPKMEERWVTILGKITVEPGGRDSNGRL